jgi:hypothetical protein
MYPLKHLNKIIQLENEKERFMAKQIDDPKNSPFNKGGQSEAGVMPKIAELVGEWKESMNAAIEDAIDKQEQQISELYNAGYEEGIKYAIEMLDKHLSNFTV